MEIRGKFLNSQICGICGKETSYAMYKFTIDPQKRHTEEPEIYFTCAKGNCRNIFLGELDGQFLVSNFLCEHVWVRKKRNVSPKKRFAVMKRDKFKCVLCGATAADRALEVDHIQPVSKGGANDIDNLQTLCFRCNRGKGAE